MKAHYGLATSLLLAIFLLVAGAGFMPFGLLRAAEQPAFTVASDAQTEFSLDGKTWLPAVATWVHPAWPTLKGATWIWRVAKVSKDEAVKGSAVISFRRKFTVPAGGGAQGALQITADHCRQRV